MLDYKGQLSGTIALNTFAEVNEEVKLAAAGQKSEKARFVFTPMEKARVVQYSSVGGVRTAVRRFSRD